MVNLEFVWKIVCTLPRTGQSFSPIRALRSTSRLGESPLALKRSELFLEFPLQFRFLAAGDVLATAARTEFHHGQVVSALRDHNKFTAVAPQAPTCDECKLETVARHRFQLQVTQPLVLDSFQKFARDLRT